MRQCRIQKTRPFGVQERPAAGKSPQTVVQFGLRKTDLSDGFLYADKSSGHGLTPSYCFGQDNELGNSLRHVQQIVQRT
jgi:hypothetical protein